MKDNTFEKIAEHFAVSGQEIRLLLKDAEKISFTPKDIVVHEREINSNLYFITQGVWRAYTFKDGVEVTLWFVSEGEMALSVWGYTSNLPSHLTLEVVTDSEAYCLSRSKLEQLFQSSISLANLGRKILENFMLEIEVAWLDSYNRTALERYVTLLEKQPEIIRAVPLKYIASYLGITAQSLSRIRNRLAGLSRHI
ncbi:MULTISPECIES: Crp/Fnr family transcriptional regulator [Culturomica]|jgi:CRP-like cAMP-binding protein|uniref:Crp/Fnr family transcriptional regulator n=1 Tax=Culturomica TaxID=1926651 RepID=UPI00033D3C5F|nr:MULTISPECIES: Crp/Fnr family transcriptional regulator [Odoribacteraceae]RHV97962.1 Crp/Fnr family transcriptional regulator [Odoribacter sp. OF09-27XD]CCZ10590.1 putative regulatory protein [Odoribacter sp. CAG:788]HBO27996.1 Crp/Fnr family transcriptional regulator [Culturomica sp.]